MEQQFFHRLSALLAGLVLGLVASTAEADIPPPDACRSGAGSTCDNAGPRADQPGVCAESTCRRATPDGSVSYSCVRCVPREGGAAGTSGAGGGATGGAGGGARSGGTSATDGSATGGAGTSGSGESKCNCELPRRGSGQSGVLLSALFGALLLRRRR